MKVKLILLSCLLLLNTRVFAQYGVGLSFSYDQIIAQYDQIGLTIPFAEFKTDFSYSTHLKLNYLINKNLRAETGFGYSSKSVVLDYNFKAYDQYDPLIPDRRDISYSYFSIPIELDIILFARKKINPVVSLGINYLKLRRSTDDVYFYNRVESSPLYAYGATSDMFAATSYVGIQFLPTKSIIAELGVYGTRHFQPMNSRFQNTPSIQISPTLSIIYMPFKRQKS